MDESNGNGNGETRRKVKPVPWNYPGETVNIGGDEYLPEDAEDAKLQYQEMCNEYERQKRHNWEDTKHGKLCLELYAAFKRYKKYLEEHSDARKRTDGGPLEYEEHKAFAQILDEINQLEKQREERDLKNLEKAKLAERCEHVHATGERCGSPKMKEGTLCYMHARMEETRAAKLDLGALEDPDSVQLGIMKLQRAVIDGTLDRQQVTQLTTLLQIAAWNAPRTKLGGKKKEEDAEGKRGW
jgi:hypothetical protein